MQSIKRKRRCQLDCKDHLLILQCLKPNASKYDVKLAFCPKFQRDPLPPEYIHPQFNNDYKYYTSAFILGVDRRALVKNEQQEIMDHQKQVRDSLEKQNQLIFPRPNSKHSHCSVCKEHYKNYYLHISSEEHRQRIAVNLYNVHIKDLCKLYIHLWEGAEERADEQAEKMEEAEIARRQKMEEMMARDNQNPQVEEDGESSLLDVQRGENEENDDRDEQYQEEYISKSKSRRASRTGNYDQTLTIRAYKRSAPSGRTYQSQYLRKKFQLNNPASSDRLARQREERKYQRQRDKVKTERDLHPGKQLIKVAEKEDDVFIIMKAAYTATVSQGYAQFVWKRTSDRVKKQAEKMDKALLEKAERGELSPQIQNQNKKYEIAYGKTQQKIEKAEPQVSKWQPKSFYYPYSSYGPHHQSKIEHKGFQTKMHDFSHMAPETKTNPESYKHPYYYPYGYNMYDQYHPRDKNYDYKEKQRQRQRQRDRDRQRERDRQRQRQKERANGQKGYEYASMPYQWPYHHPFYMPQSQPPTITAQQQTNSKTGSTNININFPMYMCPPPPNYPAPTRYPPAHPSYMNYDYPPPYPPAHPLPPHTNRDLPPIPPNPPYQGPPPQIYQSHYQPPYQSDKKSHNAHHPFPNPTHPPLLPHQNYSPYMHHYPQHYPPHHNQHPNPSSKY